MKGFFTKTKNVILSIIIVAVALLIAIFSITKNNKSTNSSLTANNLFAVNYAELTDPHPYYLDGEGNYQLDGEGHITNPCENINFEAYFPQNQGTGVARHSLGTCKSMNDKDTFLLRLEVNQDGYLKDGMVYLNGKNINFTKSSFGVGFQSSYGSFFKNKATQEIGLSERIDSGSAGLCEIDITPNVTTSEDYHREDNTIVLTGIYVDGNEVEHRIKKEIPLTVDWYGEAQTFIRLRENIKKFDNTMNRTPFIAEFTVSEIKNQLVPEAVCVNVDFNDETVKIAGEYPTSIVCEDGVYDSESHILTIRREGTERNNIFRVEITYPDSVYEKVGDNKQEYNGYSIKLPVSAYYECSNNTSLELETPYIADECKSTCIINIVVEPAEGNSTNNYYVGFEDVTNAELPGEKNKKSMILKNDIISAYNSENEEERYYDYFVRWQFARDYNLTEWASHHFEDNNGDDIDGQSIEDFVSIKSIKFENQNAIQQSGYVDIFDYSQGQKQLIKRFSYDEILLYSQKEYELEGNIKRLRVETSPMKNGIFSIIQKKSMDLTKIDISDIYEMGLLKTYCTAGNTAQDYEPNGSAECMLVTSRSYLGLIGKNYINLGLRNETELNYTIDTMPNNSPVYSSWGDCALLLELPKFVNYVKSSNFEVVTYKKGHNTRYAIKINKNGTLGSKVDVHITVGINPTAVSGTDVLVLYGYNGYNNSYFDPGPDDHDINEDGSTRDTVACVFGLLKVDITEGFNTWECISEYDNFDSRAYAPNLAQVEKGTATSAKVGVNIVNTYKSNSLIKGIENISILGKIPYANNTYIGGASLGSTFTATMKSEGISVPSIIENYTKVYYSTKEDPTNDVTNSENGWKLKEQVESFEAIRSYLIILENTQLKNGTGYEFTYEINIPEDGIKSNDKTYSCHKVFGDVVTEAGTDPIAVQPAKMGIRIYRKYNLELTKYKEGTSLPIQGAGFTLHEIASSDDDEYQSYRHSVFYTNNEGKINIEDLIANQEYSIKETDAPANYEINDKEVHFKLVEDNAGDVNFQVVSDNSFDGECTLDNSSRIPQVSTFMYDAPKYKIIVHKVDKDTNNPIKYAKFDIDGRTYITSTNGTFTTGQLVVGQTYSFKETQNDGYYVDNSELNFSLVRDGDDYVVESESEIFQNAVISNSGTDDLITVDITIENEKIPTYNLKIVKVDSENSELKLQGAKFIVDQREIGKRTIEETNANGEIYITDLYQYVDGKNITGEYEFYELEAPNGYVKNPEKIKFVVSKQNDELTVAVDDRSALETVKDVSVNGDDVIITIKDKALFTLTKMDKDTGAPLANADFVIMDTSTNDYAKDPDGNYIGTLNEEGQYVVTTDENGKIVLPLPSGTYRAVEVGYPYGYMDTPNSEVFTIKSGADEELENIPVYNTPNIGVIQKPENPYVEFSSTHNLEEETYDISKIEDLVQFAVDVKTNPNSFANKKVKLLNDLDFNKDSDYRNPNGTTFGDINGDGTPEGLKTELTTSKGFPGIGTYDGTDAVPFKGVFDGNNKKISNLYIDKDEDSYAGFFVATENAEIYNLELGGVVKAASDAAGLIVYAMGTTKADGVSLNVGVETTGENAAGIINKAMNSCYFDNCSVAGTISASENIAGYVIYMAGSVEEGEDRPLICIENSAMTATITSEGNEIGGFVGNAGLADCYANKLEINSQMSGYNNIGGVINIVGNGSKVYIEDVDSELNINGNNKIAGIIAVLGENSSCYINEVTMEDCNIISGDWGKSGGVIAYANTNTTVYVTNCNMENLNIPIQHQKGGIISECNNMKELYVDGCTLSGDFGTGGSFYIGGIAANLNGVTRAQIYNCDISITMGGSNCGGVIGYGRGGAIDVKNCTNNADTMQGISYCGGIIGKIENGLCIVQGCTNNAELTIKEYHCGGITGEISASCYIDDCVNNANIILANTSDYNQVHPVIYVGGICGRNDTSTFIKNCKNNGNIAGNWGIGGIYGYASGYAYIINCTNSGTINGYGDGNVRGIAGILGNADSSYCIAKCTNDGTISSLPLNNEEEQVCVGGILGSDRSNSSASIIYDCKNTRDLYGTMFVGGIAASAESGRIVKCINLGDIKAKDTGTYDCKIGGICGNRRQCCLLNQLW